MARIKAIKNGGNVEAWSTLVSQQIKQILDDKGITNSVITNSSIHSYYGDKAGGVNVIALNLKGSNDIAIVVSPLANISWRNVEWSKSTLQVNVVFAAKFFNMYSKYDISHNHYGWGRSRGINDTSSKIIDHVVAKAENGLNPIISNRDDNGVSMDRTKVGLKIIKSYRNSFSFNKIINLIDSLEDFSNEFSTACSLDSILDITTTIHKSTVLDSFSDIEGDLKVINHSSFGHEESGLINKTVKDEILATSQSTLDEYLVQNLLTNYSYNTETDEYKNMSYKISKYFNMKSAKYNMDGLYKDTKTTVINISDMVQSFRDFVRDFNDTNELWNIGTDNFIKGKYISNMYKFIISDATYDKGIVSPIDIKMVQTVKEATGEAWVSNGDNIIKQTHFEYTDAITGNQYATAPTVSTDSYESNLLSFETSLVPKDNELPQTTETLESAVDAIKCIIKEFDSYNTIR